MMHMELKYAVSLQTMLFQISMVIVFVVLIASIDSHASINATFGMTHKVTISWAWYYGRYWLGFYCVVDCHLPSHTHVCFHISVLLILDFNVSMSPLATTISPSTSLGPTLVASDPWSLEVSNYSHWRFLSHCCYLGLNVQWYCHMHSHSVIENLRTLSIYPLL